MQISRSQNRSKRREKKKSRVVLKTILLSFFAVVLTVAVGMFIFINTLGPPEIPAPPEIEFSYEEEDFEDWLTSELLMAPEGFTSEDRKDMFFTFLIIGLNEGTNANTIMVASFDGVNMEANLISIPRDSLMNVNRRVRKLSGAYLTGRVPQVQREVRSVIGFVPDFYVVVNYDAFEQLIDAVGGIEVYVPFHMKYDDPWQNLHIDIPAGLQQLDGENALHFARFRRSNRGFRDITDYARIENQQLVIAKTVERLRHPSNILRIPEFINIFNENIQTNLSFRDMLWFASQLVETRQVEGVYFHTAPTRGTSGYPSWYEILSGPAIVRMVNETVSPFTRDIRLSDINVIGYVSPAAATQNNNNNNNNDTDNGENVTDEANGQVPPRNGANAGVPSDGQGQGQGISNDEPDDENDINGNNNDVNVERPPANDPYGGTLPIDGQGTSSNETTQAQPQEIVANEMPPPSEGNQ